MQRTTARKKRRSRRRRRASVSQACHRELYIVIKSGSPREALDDRPQQTTRQHHPENSYFCQNNTMPQSSRSLNVLVVGAGLGGLAAGLALQTDGHKVTIIDAAPEFAEVRKASHSTSQQDLSN